MPSDHSLSSESCFNYPLVLRKLNNMNGGETVGPYLEGPRDTGMTHQDLSGRNPRVFHDRDGLAFK